MSEETQTADLPAGPRPGNRETTFFDDPVKDHLLRSLVTVTMELSVTRERLASLEALLEESGTLSEGRLDAFEPDMQNAQKREAERTKLIHEVLGPLVKRLSQDAGTS